MRADERHESAAHAMYLWLCQIAKSTEVCVIFDIGSNEFRAWVNGVQLTSQPHRIGCEMIWPQELGLADSIGKSD